MVPEGWRVTRLTELADVKRGAGSQYLTYVDSPEDGVRLIRISDFLGDSKKYILYTSAIDRFILKKEDILIAGTGATAGIIFRVPDEYAGLPFSYNAPRIRPKSTSCSGYLYYYLCSDHVIRQQHALFTGNAQPFLDTKAIGGFKVFAPPLPEQKKIAQILSTWDQAITATGRLLENSQQRKKGLMQQLLTGKKRLPGFEGEWEAKPISRTGKIISGGTPDTNDDDLWNGNVQWLTPTDITALKTHFIYDTPRKITDKGVNESSATLMPAGSLCVCTRASVGLMAISTTPITTNQGFKSVVPNTKHDVEFLYYLFSFHRYVFIRYSSGSTFMELSKKDFAKITFNYPPLAEQEAIARVLASASDEIEQLEKRIACLKQEKTALMQQLFTGKRRVQVDTEAA